MPDIRYLAVEGPIGVGKTTLAEMLADRFHANLILEQYAENPFLERFYSDRRGSAFQTQLFFLLSRYRQHQEMVHTDLFYQSVVSDYLFAKDKIFAEVNLNRDELKLYDEVQVALQRSLPTPDVVIYLQGSVSLLQQNIKKRSRSFEQTISSEYLEEIVAAYNDFFFHYRDTRLIVASCDHFDFLGRPDHFEQLVETITRVPYPPVEYMISTDSFFTHE
ncbi:MAG TPA: deoxynucleoside kinase [Candidatus Kapabacteria bacterium]|nr:deoxynucleoside kinase [Candidatus Kapabacteria bacterium]